MSRDVHDGTLASRDLKDRTIAGRDVDERLVAALDEEVFYPVRTATTQSTSMVWVSVYCPEGSQVVTGMPRASQNSGAFFSLGQYRIDSADGGFQIQMARDEESDLPPEVDVQLVCLR